MTRPVVTETTERVYASLPAVYRVADAAQGEEDNQYPLLRYLGVALDTTAAPIDALLDRLLPIISPYNLGSGGGSTLAGDGLAGEGTAGGSLGVDVLVYGEGIDGVSELGDPALADLAWLPWLAQFVGVRVNPTMTEAAQRSAIANGSSGWRVGTRASVAAAAATALTGSRYLRVVPQRKVTAGIAADGGFWDLLLITRASETPSTAAVLAAIAAAGAKPAGVLLWVLAYTATWAQIEAAYPTWADRDGKTWGELEETGA